MVKYDVIDIATELMLTPSDLRSIFQIYFDEAEKLLLAGQAAMSKQDYTTVANTMHAMKGASLNLRMQEIGNSIAYVEGLAKKQREVEISLGLLRIKEDIRALKEHIEIFYANN